MKPSFRLLFALTLLLSIFLPSISVMAQDATPTAADNVFRDPDGRYTVPIPTNWTVEEDGNVVTLVDPDGDLRVDIVVIQADDAAEGVLAAFQATDPVFEADASPIDEQTVPSTPGVDETVVITYDIGETSGNVEQGVGQRVGDQVYVLIFTGSLDAAMRRGSQIQIVASGFTISSLETTDLAQIDALPFEGAIVEAFEAYVIELLERLEVPGASIAVVQNGEIVYLNGFGVRQIGGQESVTPGTRMMIGSTTKSMTTMMMATEVDDGLMSWDTPAREILPEFAVADPELSETITVRNLVCACTGVPRRDLEFIFNADELSAEDVIAQLETFEFFTGFGEAFQYSNQMVATGGYVAAAAAGGAYGNLFSAYLDEMDARVFGPIGMENTTFSFEAVRGSADWATPHGASLDGVYEPIPLSAEATLIPIAPAGAVWSTAEDMARYVITQMSGGVAPDGTRVVSEENLAETWQPQVQVDADTSYGLGWLVQDFNGQLMIHHGGNTLGFTSDLAFLPDAGIGIVVLSNAQASNLFNEGVRYRLLELLFEQPQEFDKGIEFQLEQAAASYAEIMSMVSPIAFEDSVELLGTYENPILGQIEVSSTGDRLRIDAGEFATDVRGFANPSKPDARYVISVDPPIAGTPIEVSVGDDGLPALSIDLTTDLYVFTRVEGTGVAPSGGAESGSD